MDKIYITYFYNIRNLKPNMVPISTAVWDPVWYHNGTRNKYKVFRDKNGVINGVRLDPLAPGKTCANLCRGRGSCNSTPDKCQFLIKYREQLDELDFTEITKAIDNILNEIGDNLIPVLVVYEIPLNPCSERSILIKWFNDNGIELKEFEP